MSAVTQRFFRGGGQACAVVGCSNNRKYIYEWKKSNCDIHDGLVHEDCPCCYPFSLHKLPKDENRLKWISSLNRKHLPKDVFVCSIHFVDERPTQQNPYPTLNLGYKKPACEGEGRRVLNLKRRANESQTTTVTDVERVPSMICDEELTKEDQNAVCQTSNHIEEFIVEELNSAINKPSSFVNTATQWIDPSLDDHSYNTSKQPPCPSCEDKNTVKICAEKGVNCNTINVTTSSSTIINDSVSNLFTGLTLIAFQTLVKVFETTEIPFKFTMPVSDQILLTLMKLRLNLLFADLAHRFGISESHASNIFNHWLPFLAARLKDLVFWLPRETIRATMPSSFKEKYPKTTVIIDCAETFLQRPKNLKTRGETYSHYKSHNTVKYLVGIAPHGQIMFISKGFGGRASDKFIVQNSGFLNFLLPGDEVMADRGFTIEDLLFPLRVKLNIPAFTRGKDQLSENDVTETRRIAHVRIHVERAIRRLKVYKILSDIIPISCAKKADDILIVCSALCNLGNPLIKEAEDSE